MLRLFLCFSAVLWAALCSAAPVSVDLSTLSSLPNGGRDKVVMEMFMDAHPQRGHAPVRVFIHNRGKNTGEWTFQFASQSGYNEQNAQLSEFRLRVEAGKEQSVEWMVPIYSMPIDFSYHRTLDVSVKGPEGFQSHGVRLVSDSSNRGAVSLAGLSESLSLLHREALQAEVQNKRGSEDLRFARVDLAMLPENPQGLFGLDLLVLTRAEWKDLPPAIRYSLRQWIAMGGRVVFADSPGPAEPLGHGAFHALMFAGQPASSILSALERVPTLTDRLEVDPQAFAPFRWKLRATIPDISRPVGLLLLFVFGIGALLGPVNLLLAHRKKRPARVLWTTPVLSAGLSLLLILVIIFSDGFGGKGARSLAVLLLPDDQVEILVQEQVSRTGVLLNDSFRIPSAVSLSQLNVTPARRGRRRNESTGRFRLTPDGTHSGDWFKSRRIQGQMLYSSRPSRAAIRILPGSPPDLYSTVDTLLMDIVVRDGNGAYWTVDSLRAGERKPLRSLSPADAQSAIKTLRTREDDALSNHLNPPHGWFYARAEAGKGPFIDTQASIRWVTQPVCWFGPLATGDAP
jgi:hypothetical protein